MATKASLARMCQQPTETVRVIYNDAITCLARELRPDFKGGCLDEEWLEDVALRRFFGPPDAQPDAHVTGALIILVSPLAPKLELESVDLVSWATASVAQDLIAEAKRKGYGA